MSISQMFQEFLANIKVDTEDQISRRYEEITCVLNKKFRNTDSKNDNQLQVGSYGRWTAIKGVSDLDMLYIMPSSKWNDYKDGGQYKLLKETKDAILERYPSTTVYVDRLVVCVKYTNFHVEVQPVFEQEDGSFKYPDTYKGSKWLPTKPRAEISEIQTMNDAKNRNLRRLCKMVRAWKNKSGLGIGGLLIDTLAYNFLKQTAVYDSKSYASYDELSRDFFKFLSDQPDQDHYQALGSNQDVKVKTKFQEKANDAYENALKAIARDGQSTANKYWRKIYGSSFPEAKTEVQKSAMSINDIKYQYRKTEEFIDEKFPIDIRYPLKIECEITKQGSLSGLLRPLQKLRKKVEHGKSLRFYIEKNGVPNNIDEQNYTVFWKVLNCGEIAKKRDCIRGQIVKDLGQEQKNETAGFNGEHIVECYIVQNGVVVARDQIFVPIEDNL